MSQPSKGQLLHQEAAKAREEGNYVLALQSNDEAMLAFDQENDDVGFTEVIADRSIVLRHYADAQKSRNCIVLAKHELLGAVTIARSSKQKEALALPLYNLAQVLEDLDELQEAVATYKEAILAMQNNPPVSHNRSSVLLNMKIHRLVCEYKAGNTQSSNSS